MSTVLILEDEAVLRTSMARGLVKLTGIETLEAGTFADALKVIETRPPDLILSDIDLPDRSGIEILGELGRLGLNPPVVFISGYLKAYHPQIPKHANIEVREKPVALDELRQLVLQKLGNSEYESEAPFAVADYLQLACLGKHSVVIECAWGDSYSGMIQVVEGEIWYVRDIFGTGKDAFRRVLFADATSVRCSNLRDEPEARNIDEDWQQLLMETVRIHDEANAEIEAAAEPETPELLEAVIVEEAESEPLEAVIVEEAAAELLEAVIIEEAAAESPEAAIVEELPPEPPEVGAAGSGTPESHAKNFDQIWELGVEALLEKRTEDAMRAFLEAAEIRPDHGGVIANLERLRAMGISVD